MVSAIAPAPKDPDEVLDYEWDFTADLTDGEALSSYTVTADGATLDTDSMSGAAVTAWVSGGTDGTNATIAYRVVTDNVPPRTIERTLQLRIRER